MKACHLHLHLLPLALCGGLAAQGTAPTHKPSIVEVPYGIGSGSFQRVEFLLPPYSPSHQRDAIVLRGGVLGHVRGIGVHNYVEPFGFPVAVTDMARLPGGHPTTPGHDALLVSHVGSHTLARVHWLDADNRQIIMFPMSGWQGASALTVAPTGAGYEISAMAQDRQTLLRGTGGPAGIATVSAYWVGVTIRATALGDVDGDGQLETLALTDGGVVIVNRDGTFRSNLAWPHAGGSLARAGTKVYWLRRNAADTRWELTVAAGAAPITDPPDITLPNGDFTLSSMVASDVDQDAEPDLLVGQSSTLQAIQVRVTDASPGVLDVEQYYVALATQLPVQGGSTGPVASVDLDGDGYDDIVMARDNGSMLAIVRGTAHGRVYAGPVEDLPPLLHATSVFAGPSHQYPGLHLHFDDSGLFHDPAYTDVLVNVWVQSDATTPPAGASQINRAYQIVAGPPSTIAHSIYIPTGTGGVSHTPAAFWHLEVVFGNGEATPPGKGLIFTVAGFAHHDPAGATVAYLSAGDAHLESLNPTGDPPSEARPPKGPNTPPPAGRERTGGYRPIGGIMPPITKPTRAAPSSGVTQPVQ